MHSVLGAEGILHRVMKLKNLIGRESGNMLSQKNFT